MELTDKEKKRAKKLQQILTKLENGEHVQRRTLKTSLTKDEYSALDDDWEEQKELREELKDKPDDIIEYEKRLKKALFAYHKYASYENPKTIEKAKNNSDNHFERLLEHLQEILHADPMLCQWFDRPISFEHGEEPGLDPITIPRVVTSRSLDCQSTHFRKLNKNQIKQDIVSNAINQINNQAIDIDPQAFKDKLKKLRASW